MRSEVYFVLSSSDVTVVSSPVQYAALRFVLTIFAFPVYLLYTTTENRNTLTMLAEYHLPNFRDVGHRCPLPYPLCANCYILA